MSLRIFRSCSSKHLELFSSNLLGEVTGSGAVTVPCSVGKLRRSAATVSDRGRVDP